ncbi:hypothetical protein AKJ16_DCAP16793, partial [Drosera capensis]
YEEEEKKQQQQQRVTSTTDPSRLSRHLRSTPPPSPPSSPPPAISVSGLNAGGLKVVEWCLVLIACFGDFEKWSRWAATMLPWLVIPLIGLWALSQLLPPAFRFEITSSRLACVFVLLVTLFWYEVLMPQLSAWRVRRNGRLRERKRLEALELQKLKKTATRKCRNCLTPYRDQNPGGGKFMCSYCGHISKRPVLDLPIPSGLGISNSGIIKELFGKSGKILNGKVWSDNGAMCPEWLDHGNWVVGRNFVGKSTYLRKGVGPFGVSEQFLDEKSFQPGFIFPGKFLMGFLKNIRWLCRKLLRISSREDGMSDAENREMLANRGENGGNCSESRGEKARRKAEEKRQARLEKEQLEEEERKQREEVARLVEERRKLRDEKLEAESRAKGISSIREKDRKEAERRLQERRKEKDRSSCISNSDTEELGKKVGKDSERKRDAEKKNENDKRELQKIGSEGVKGHSGTGSGVKTSSTNSWQGNAGARYFDRMKGTFLSSSRALTGGSFFSKATLNAPVSKETKSSGSVGHAQVSANRKDPCPTERVPSKMAPNGDGQNINPSRHSDLQPRTAPKSWQQLFTKTPSPPASSYTNVISRPVVKPHNEAQNCQSPSQLQSAPTYDNPIDFGFPSPFSLPALSDGLMISGISAFPAVKEPLFPHAGGISHDLLPEEPELFEDPCYEPDPVSLLGPVSESLHNFQLDLGAGFMPQQPEKPRLFMNASTGMESSRPSPIESPISRLRNTDERQSISPYLPSSPRDLHPFPPSDLNTANGMGTWHMWRTSPLGQDGLGFHGEGASWSSSLDPIRSSNEDVMLPSPHKNMASLFSPDAPLGAYSAQKISVGNYQHDAFASSIPGLKDHDLWQSKTPFPPLLMAENISPTNCRVQDTSQLNKVYGSPGRGAASHFVDLFPSNNLSKNEWELHVSGGLGNSKLIGSVQPQMISPLGHLNEKK